MAEFVEVMRQMRRMREQKNFSECELPCTDGCIIAYLENFEFDWLVNNAKNVEKSVMQWAAEHPEPKLVYPTFAEWQRENFPDKTQTMFPCSFLPHFDDRCLAVSCATCAEQTRIPEDVAKKLGIEPKEWGETINERV